MVTREKHLHIQKLADDELTPTIHSDIKNYRVLKLMMGWHDDKMFALGTSSANHKMLLLELTMPRASTDKVSVTELTPLPGLSYEDEFAERLSGEERGEKYVLIAALTGTNKRAIYRVRLPGLPLPATSTGSAPSPRPSTPVTSDFWTLQLGTQVFPT